MNGATRLLLAFFLLTVPFFTVAGQDGISISLSPGIDVPLGPNTDELESGLPYSTGFSTDASVLFPLPLPAGIYGKGGLVYCAVPTKDGPSSDVPDLSIISIGGGLGVTPLRIGKLSFGADLVAGPYLGVWKNSQSMNLFASGTIGADYIMHPAFSAGISVSYRHYFAQSQPLYHGLSASLAVRYHIGAAGRTRVKFEQIRINPVFPVLYHYFDDNPLGTVTIRNNEGGTIRDVRVSFLVKQYMEDATLCGVIPKIKKGEEKTFPLFALFSDAVMEITEGTEVAGRITVDYEYSGGRIQKEQSETVKLLYRNAMTWDDDRKAAAFVTARDTAVLHYAKNCLGAIRDSSVRGVTSDFRQALVLFETLGLSGLNYIVDPNSSYAELSEDQYSLDYLQFPSETLSYRAGDCDDLSILYTALLESVGIKTAFITVPGHIYMAFSLGLPEREAARLFLDKDSFIVKEETVWIPVEVTMVGSSFLDAWNRGIEQWKEYDPQGKTGFFPVRDAWKEYSPVAGPGSVRNVDAPQENRIVKIYEDEMTRFIEKEIAPRVAALEEQIRRGRNSERYYNKLGVLYARFGLFDKAKSNFEAALRGGQHLGARVNLGNVFFLQNRYEEALAAYERALEMASDNAGALLGAARCTYKLKEMDAAGEYLGRLKEIDPDRASRYAYITGGAGGTERASEGMRKEMVLWEEEE